MKGKEPSQIPCVKKTSPSWVQKNAKGFTSKQGQDIVEG